MNHKRPNFLFVMVDEERFPPVYETKEAKKWKKKNLIFHELMRKNGLEFRRHYIGSSACSPSRTTLFTGQYPSLHGVTQTTGADLANPCYQTKESKKMEKHLAALLDEQCRKKRLVPSSGEVPGMLPCEEI